MLPQVTDNLTIDGGNNITISGDTDNDQVGDVRLLWVLTSVSVTLQNLTLTYGKDTVLGGGAILNYGILTIENTTISNSESTASNAGGGAIYLSGNNAVLNLTNSTVTGNTAYFFGGAIYNTIGGTLNITNSTFTDNSSDVGAGAIYSNGPLTITGSNFTNNQALGPLACAGAIYFNEVGGTATITDSVFSANQAKFGGGLCVSHGTVNIDSSTFSGNTSNGDGGAVYVGGNGEITATNSTFSGNTATGRGGGIFAFGPVTLTNTTVSDNAAGSSYAGGIHMYGAILTITNVIIANSITGGDCILDSSAFIGGSSSNNLIEDAVNACGLTNGTNGNVVGSDPVLGPLQNNGGSTDTHVLLSGSPAINTGTNTGCPATDQIGTTRPQGGTCDMGAFELPHTTLTLTSVGTNDGWVLESTETSGVGGSINSTSTLFYVGDGAADKQYISILHFDTAALPDTAVIASATLKVKKYAVVGTDPFTILGDLVVDMRRPTFGAIGLTTGDFQTVAGRVAVATFGTVPVSNWYSAVLNGSGRNYLNKTGTTQFRLRFTIDDDDDGATDYMKFYSGNHGNSAVWPMLVIEYYVP